MVKGPSSSRVFPIMNRLFAFDQKQIARLIGDEFRVFSHKLLHSVFGLRC